MIPIVVTAILQEPVITYGSQVDHLCLDGPLSWALMRQAGELPPMGDWPLDFEVPLAKWTLPLPTGLADPRLYATGVDAVWGWCSGPGRYDALRHGRMEVRRSPCISPLQAWTDADTVQIAMGRFKGKDVSYPSVVAREIRWSAVGDPAEVRRLLSSCPGVGKLRHHGNGAVSEWLVEEGGHADDWKRGRYLPDATGIPRGIRAPYWHASREAPCSICL